MASNAVWKDPHEADAVHMTAQERQGTDWDKIEEHRAEIKALKEQQRLSKLDPTLVDDHKQEKIEESHNQWTDPHDKDAKVIAADSSKWDNDWDKIEKQRAEIKAIKEKKRIYKMKESMGMVDTDEETLEKIEKSHNQWKDPHEKDNKLIKADNSKWDNDWDKIEKQRAEIKAIKEKKRMAKLMAEENGGYSSQDEETQKKIERSHSKWKDMHEQVIKADTSKWDNDWDKIEKQRAEIRAIKEKKRISKLQNENDLKERNKKKKETEKKFKNAHEDSGIRRTSSNRHFQDKKEQELLKKRAEIKAIKEKKRLERLQSENDLKERNKKKKETDKKFKNAHEKDPKKIKADTGKWDNDWDKINKQRAEIKAIKERKRREKAEKEAREQELNSPRARALSASKTKSKKTVHTTSSKKKKKKTKTRLESSSDEDRGHSASPPGDQFRNPHERDPKKIKADTSKWDNDWDKINKQRAEIKAIKEKKRISKLQHENELKERNKKKKETDKKFKNAHEKDPKKIKADTSKWDNDWDKINKQRAEIRAIKEKKRISKLQNENDLKERNKKKKETDKKFKNAHEAAPKKIKAKERVGNDWDKIEKQRASIKALKEKRKREKEMGISNSKKTVFGDPHER